MELVTGMTRHSDGSGFVGMLELAMAATLPEQDPAVVVQLLQEVANFHLAILPDGVLGEAGQAAVGGLAEEEAGGTVLGVGLELVGDVRGRRAGDVVAVQLDGAGAVGATELCVVVDEGFGDGLELPEGLVSTADLEATSFDLALVDFF
jgi:hypothetical protein